MVQVRQFAIHMAVVLAGSGCASQVMVTYYTDPPGAALYQAGEPFGLTPLYLVYTVDDEYRKGGCMRLQEIQFRWLSGSTASKDDVAICAEEGYSKALVIERPEGSGRETDLDYAARLRRDPQFKLQEDYAVRGGRRAKRQLPESSKGGAAGQGCARRSMMPPYYGKCSFPPAARLVLTDFHRHRMRETKGP